MIAIHPHRRSAWYFIFEGIFSAFTWVSAKIQASRILRNLPVSHFWWAVGTVVLITVIVVAYKKTTRCRWREALELGLSMLILRFVTFTPLLNKLRGKKWFYLGRASVIDRTFATVYVWMWLAAIVTFIGLQIY